MSSERAVIALKGVGKTYRTYARPQHRLLERITRNPRAAVFDALKDISLDIRARETVGIVGVNGSGKSTLLQIVCGTLRPSTGTVSVDGRISALLELGAGFDPDFTGRENVYLNGALQGLSRREVDARIDAIEAFADIGAHFDLPLSTYSSGMIVRVGFAAAVHADPDILVIDEALAVGDERFQRKCFARLNAIREAGATILFVSHSTASVLELCDRAVLLDAGRLVAEGSPKHVVNQYQRLQNLDGAERAAAVAALVAGEDVPQPATAPMAASMSSARFDATLVPEDPNSYETNGAAISDIRLCDDNGQPANILPRGAAMQLRYRVTFDRACRDVGFGMVIKTLRGTDFAGATTAFTDGQRLDAVAAGAVFDVAFDIPGVFAPGTYLMNVGVSRGKDNDLDYLHRVLDALMFKVEAASRGIATSLVDIGIAPTVTRVSG